VQVVIALVVTPGRFPLAYEGLPGNTSDRIVRRKKEPLGSGLQCQASLKIREQDIVSAIVYMSPIMELSNVI